MYIETQEVKVFRLTLLEPEVRRILRDADDLQHALRQALYAHPDGQDSPALPAAPARRALPAARAQKPKRKRKPMVQLPCAVCGAVMVPPNLARHMKARHPEVATAPSGESRSP